jgi:hypothetical protein
MQQHYIDGSQKDMERRFAAGVDPAGEVGGGNAQVRRQRLNAAKHLASALQRAGIDRRARRRRSSAIGRDDAWSFHDAIMGRGRPSLKSQGC